MSGDSPVRVSILVPSIGRTSLARTISGARVAALRLGRTYEIIVVDDSLTDAAAALCAALPGYNGDLTVVTSASQNIATARNTGLAAARGEWLAFIDDDEWPEEDWLVRHFAVVQNYGCDAIVGPVRAHYPAEASQWIRSGDPYSRWYVGAGTVLKRGSTANALIRRAIFDGYQLTFDASFGRSGGEDADLFGRMYRHGVQIVGSDGLVNEDVPLSRCSLRDLTRRAIRVGQTFASSEMGSISRTKRVGLVATSTAKAVAYAGAACILLPLGGRCSLPLLQKAFRNMGKVSFLSGQEYISYYRGPAEEKAVGRGR